MSTDHDAGHPPFRILSMAELLDLGPHVPTEPALIEIEPGENLNRPTWTALVRHEPDLAALLTEIVAVRADGSRFCANDIWYGAFKPRLVRMVGTGAVRDDPFLRTSATYDLAYQRLYAALPDCRDCFCLPFGRLTEGSS